MIRKGSTKPSYRITLIVLLAVSASLAGEHLTQTGPPSTSPQGTDNFPSQLSSWDTGLYLWVNVGLLNSYVSGILSVLTYLGGFSASVVLCGSLFLIGQRRRGILASASITLVTVLTIALKVIVARPRPFMVIPEALPAEMEGGSAFPSGHASRVFSLLHLTRARSRRLVLIGYVLAGLVAFSRVYLGVHYPLDVLGGMVLGLTSGRIVRHYEGRFVARVENAMERLKMFNP